MTLSLSSFLDEKSSDENGGIRQSVRSKFLGGEGRGGGWGGG